MLKINEGRQALVTTGPAYLDSVIASAVFDLDATIAASYGGTGTTWANLIAAPADGSAQSAYDFYTGNGSTGTTYPAFNGTAGSAAAYWSCDGGDFFALKSGANPAFLKNLQKTTGGTDYWIAMTYRHVEGSGEQRVLTTQTTATTIGLSMNITAAEQIQLRQRGDTSSVAATNTAVTLTGGANYIVIASFSLSGSNARFWVNSATANSVSLSPNTTVTDPPAAAAHIGSTCAQSGNFFNSGTRFYSIAMGNEYLDNTKAAAIIAHLEARHGRDYTP